MNLDGQQHLTVTLKPRWTNPLSTLTLWWKIGSGRLACAQWIRIEATNVVLSSLIGLTALGGGWWFVTQGLVTDTEAFVPVVAADERTDDDSTRETNLVDIDVFRRSDLFDSPRRSRRREPRSNPVELLEMLELRGVLGGEVPRAIIVYKKTKQSHTLAVGDMLGEFEIIEIKPRSVMLKWRDDTFELSL